MPLPASVWCKEAERRDDNVPEAGLLVPIFELEESVFRIERAVQVRIVAQKVQRVIETRQRERFALNSRVQAAKVDHKANFLFCNNQQYRRRRAFSERPLDRRHQPSRYKFVDLLAQLDHLLPPKAVRPAEEALVRRIFHRLLKLRRLRSAQLPPFVLKTVTKFAQ